MDMGIIIIIIMLMLMDVQIKEMRKEDRRKEGKDKRQEMDGIMRARKMF
jgi:hypothetical protein